MSRHAPLVTRHSSRTSFSDFRDRILVRADAVEVAHRIRHARPDAHHQLGAIVVGQTFRLYRLEEVDVDDAGTYAEGALGHHFARTMDDRRNDRALRRDREHERSLLERPEMIVAAARALRIHDDGTPALDLLRRHLI